MGYSSVQVHKGDKPLDILKQHSSWFVGSRWTSTSGVDYEVTAMALGGQGVAYGILTAQDPAAGKPVNTAVIIKTERNLRSQEFAWKVMGELDGPYYYGMPQRLLAKLTPADQAYADPAQAARAQAWRDLVKAAQESAALRKQLKADTTILFESPLLFRMAKGIEHRVSRFRVLQAGRSLRFHALDALTGAVLFACKLRRTTLQRERWQVLA